MSRIYANLMCGFLAGVIACQDGATRGTSAAGSSSNDGLELIESEVPEIEVVGSGLQKDRGGSSGDFNYCNGTATCDEGEGDCDADSECTPGQGLVCGQNNGAQFEAPAHFDFCVPAHCTNRVEDADEDPGRIDCGGSCGECACPGVSGDPRFCTPSCRCSAGEGDCDDSLDCEAGLICGVNNGPSFGMPANFDVCVPPGADGGVPPPDSGVAGGGSVPIERVNIASDGTQAIGDSTASQAKALSTDGRYVTFFSGAANLVAADTNAMDDVFVHDRQTGATTRVSVASAGAQGNGASRFPAISADGRFVAFVSDATNLVASDTNGVTDVFLHDRQTGATTRVSVDSTGAQADGLSAMGGISADGAAIVFESTATNLVAADTNGSRDIFVHERVTGQTTRVSLSTSGTQGNGTSESASISADGRWVSFASGASNLVAGDTNLRRDIFLRDRQTGETTRVSVSSLGTEGNASSFRNKISGNGRYVVFDSNASNLVPDTNASDDIFVHDRQTAQTTRVNVDSGGGQANDGSASRLPDISADGRFVVFSSNAVNLVPNDTNGMNDIFVHDRQTGGISLVSVASGGAQGNDNSNRASISPDGRLVSFDSGSSTLVPNKTISGRNDVLVAPNPLAP